MANDIWKGKRIIIVDDSKRIREDLKIKYTSLGMSVVGEAEDGLIALATLKDQEVDLVSIDIIMPEMNGFELYQRISKEMPHVLCFFVSCLSLEQKFVEACQQQYNMDIFFQKPLDPLVFAEWLSKNYSAQQEKKLKLAV